MKTFIQYLEEEKGLDIDKILPKHGSPLGGIDKDDNHDGLLRVLQMAAENHYGDIMDFMCNLARKDPRLQDELSQMNMHGLNKHAYPKHKKRLPGERNADDGHEVMPNLADRGDSAGGEPTS